MYSITSNPTITFNRCSCGSEDPSEQWVSQNDIHAFLNEILLSYRLLFGQVKSSRQFFRRHLEPLLAADVPPEGQDPLLAQLCGSRLAATSILAKEKSIYRLDKDFPMLHSRLAILAKHVEGTKPRGWKELWRDKRDSAQWVTFWAVIIIGSLGLLLAFLQVVLGIVQTTRSS